MSDVNVIVLSGRLTKDPDVRSTSSNIPVLNLTIASNQHRKDPSSPADAPTFLESAVFIKAVAFGGLADRYAARLKKGSYVEIQGELRDDSYEKDGVKHFGTAISINKLNQPMFKQEQDAPAKEAE